MKLPISKPSLLIAAIAGVLLVLFPLFLVLLSEAHQSRVNEDITRALTDSFAPLSSTTAVLSTTVSNLKVMGDLKNVDELNANKLVWEQMHIAVNTLCAGVQRNFIVPDSFEGTGRIVHSCGVLMADPDQRNPSTFLLVSSQKNKVDKTLTFNSEVASILKKDAERGEATVFLSPDNKIRNIVMVIPGLEVYLILGGDQYLTDFK